MNMTVSQAFEALESLVKYAGIASDTEALSVLREYCVKDAWLPIETAPKYEVVMVWNLHYGEYPEPAKYVSPEVALPSWELEKQNFPEGFEEWFAQGHGWLVGNQRPTHWQPLPKPPKDYELIKAMDAARGNPESPPCT